MIYELRMYTTRAGKTKEVVNASATVAQSIRDGDDLWKINRPLVELYRKTEPICSHVGI